MLVILIKMIIGFILLLLSADSLVKGAAGLAKRLGVSTLIIGLTIVALGTSAPEIIVSIIASIAQNPGIAIGNALGSNIANIGLVIGICAIIKPLPIEPKTIKLELPLLVIITVGFSILMYLLGLSYLLGTILLVSIILYIIWLTIRGKETKNSDAILNTEFIYEIHSELTYPKLIALILFGLIILPISSNMLVETASIIARTFGISDLVIGITIVAIGTSLPELAASVVSTLKKEYSLAIGNIIGSNIFNLTAVMVPPCFISSNAILDEKIFPRDIPILLLITILFIFFARNTKVHKNIKRTNGIILLLIYCAYIGALVSTVSYGG